MTFLMRLYTTHTYIEVTTKHYRTLTFPTGGRRRGKAVIRQVLAPERDFVDPDVLYEVFTRRATTRTT